MSYVDTKEPQISFFSKYLKKKQLSIAIGEIQTSLNLKRYHFQQFWMNDSKVCLEIVQQVMGKYYVNYNFILNK